MVFLIAYVFAVSALLTSLEMARYRYQIEAFIWVVSCAFLSEGWRRRRKAAPAARRAGGR
jgi:hypothetical protein